MRAVLLCLVLVSAGCAAPTQAPSAVDPQQAPNEAESEGTGRLVVVVVTPDIVPIEGAAVLAAGQQEQTDAEGIARFAALPVGAHVVTAQAEGHGSTTAAVDVRAGNETRMTLKLLQDVQPAAAGAHQREFRLDGFFDCSATYLIITGDCMAAADFAVQSAAGGCTPMCPGELTNEAYVLEFPLLAGWTTVVAEMFWQPGTTAGDKMTFAVEPAEAPADGHAAKYARTGGTGPLWLRMDNGVPHPSASLSADGEAPDMPQSAGGEVLRTRSFVQGEMHNPGGTTFLGVGAAIEQRFEVIVTVFYGEAAPESFTVA